MDLGEERMGAGGGDQVVEVKVWNSIRRAGDAAPGPTVHRGATHAFGNTEECALYQNLGVAARDGDAAWSNVVGAGKVKAHKGFYDDALTAKGNTVNVRLHNIFGGLAPGAMRDLRDLGRRDTDDRTDYHVRPDLTFAGHAPYVCHWGQRLGLSVVEADAQRCLARIDKLRSGCAAARPRAREAP